MATGDSVTSICQTALIALGEPPIADVSDNSKAAILLRNQFDPVRRAALRTHPWSFARARARLAESATPPLFGYDHAYPLPADCLRLLDLPGIDAPDWEIFGAELHTDAGAPLDVTYVRDLADPLLFDAAFSEVLALSLAVRVCEPLAQDTARKQRLAQDLAAALGLARLVTSQENSPRDWDADIWLRSRR